MDMYTCSMKSRVRSHWKWVSLLPELCQRKGSVLGEWMLTVSGVGVLMWQRDAAVTAVTVTLWLSFQPAALPSLSWCSTTPTPTRWFRWARCCPGRGSGAGPTLRPRAELLGPHHVVSEYFNMSHLTYRIPFDSCPPSFNLLGLERTVTWWTDDVSSLHCVVFFIFFIFLEKLFCIALILGI